MAIRENFIGMNQFVVFYGVVEDRQDPQYTGRVRVRCLGFHTKNKLLLPTADLPWAQVLLPITSSGISGVGQTPLGLVEGSWVVGYFRDGPDAQEPIVLGSLPGKPAEQASDVANPDDGFYDPTGHFPRYKNESDVNRLAINAKQSTDEDGDTWVEKMIVSATGTGELIKVYQRVKDGTIVPEFASTVVDSAGDILNSKSVTEVIDKVSGIKNKITDAVTGKITSATGKITNAVESVKSIASGKKINFQSLALKAVESNPAASLLLQRATQIKDVATAIPGVWASATGGVIGGDISGLITAAKSAGSLIKASGNITGTFSEPDTGYAAVYPFNHVRETESGHIVEFDDTDGAERIQERHKTGTGYFINPQGTRCVKVVYDQFHFIEDHDRTQIGMDKDVSVGGNYSVRIGNHLTISSIGGNITIEAKTGKINLLATDDINITTKSKLNLKCQEYNLTVDRNMTEDVRGARISDTSSFWELTGSRIDLN